jgi:hypothetical protein
MYLSFHLNVSSGATIVLVGAAIFLVTYVVQLLRERTLLPKEGTLPTPIDTITTHQHPHEHAGFFHVHEHSNHEEDKSEER